MITLDTSDDRTLFFDLLPVLVRSRSGVRIKLKLYTVPGQAIHAATRKLVLKGADGLVFVADSQLSMAAENQKYWHGMRQYLRELGMTLISYRPLYNLISGIWIIYAQNPILT